ncbi:MAG: hypothetical protein LBP56_08735 [Odoribacteraceae bacterium]|jgi:tRNA threonylcarbamoyladenosine biosynthesis protein TsaB|nr:hypothetical protein [Odoribacteraceae bacterium]
MLTVAISTSSGQRALVIGEEGRVLFDSTTVAFPAGAELVEMLAGGLARVGREPRAIGSVVVDVGPGGTSRVRTGVAFANALAYALDVTVCPVSSMELAGLDAWASHRLPVIHTVKSIRGTAYVGLADGERSRALEYGAVAEIVPRLASGAGALVVMGSHREEILRWGEGAGVSLVDSGRAYGDARFLVEREAFFATRAARFPGYAAPVTEQAL